MLYRVIDAGELPALVSAFMETYEVVAPVKRGRSYAFEVIESFDEIELDYPTTIASPKKYFLPPKETLLEFDACEQPGDGLRGRDHAPRHLRRARVRHQRAQPAGPGVQGRPLPRSLLRGAPRRHARGGRELHARPRRASVICGEADEARYGYDLFLQDIGGKYLVSISSVEAANILEAACDPRVATDEDRIEFRHATRRRQAAFNPDIPDIQEVAMLMDAFHKDPFWDELGGRCLSCTACSAVCPTCFCFDIQDVRDPDGQARAGASACRTRARRPQFAARGGRPQLPPRRAQAACATACTTSSTAFWPTTTACSAWDAGAA